jgi:hypothetical protein
VLGVWAHGHKNPLFGVNGIRVKLNVSKCKGCRVDLNFTLTALSYPLSYQKSP